ncbi:unnamed protein product, partial [Polarella glacialis]
LDFLRAEGIVRLDHGQLSAEIELTVCGKGRYEVKEEFRLVLSDATGGAKFDHTTDGGLDSCVAHIVILPDEGSKTRVDRMMNILAVDWHKAELGHANWKDQFTAALLVNGGDSEADPPTAFDWAMHVTVLPFKLLFATIPPTDYCGGWLCFVCALSMIGLVTALIGDLA